MKENKAKVKGDRNMVFQGIKKSEINTAGGKDKKNTSTIIGILIAFAGLIVAIIVGWKEIITFLGL